MKALIWIIILALVAWGVWALMSNGDAVENADTGATAAGALNSDANVDTGVDASTDVDTSEFEDKG